MDEKELMMRALCGEDTYKYLGMEQRRMNEKDIIKQRLQEEFQSRLHEKAINSYTVIILPYLV